ncbi:MAG: metallophosphoesterase family protein [Longimicrobiales bacterium]
METGRPVEGPRVAALYDIHGNLPALEAVLAVVRDEGVDEVVVGGDVLPGPMPAGCLAALAALDLPVRYLRGNGEADVLATRSGDVPARVPERVRPLLEWTVDAVPDAALDRVASWPGTVPGRIVGLGSVLFCHATPRDDNELFTRETPEARLRPVVEGPGTDVVVCGHTHMAFDREVGAVRVVNAGSVGLPFGTPGAFWALLGPDVSLRRTAYDLDDAMRRFEDAGYPGLADFDVRRPPDERAMLDRFEAMALGATP